MNAQDRRFLRRLLLVFGPLFVLGGFFAAFTVVGAVLIFVGVGMFATGLLLFTRLPVMIPALLGAALAIALTTQMVLQLAGHW